MVAPSREGLPLASERAFSFTLDFCFLEIRRAVIRKRRFSTKRWKFVLTSVMSFDFERLFGFVQRVHRFVVAVRKRKTARCLFAIAGVNPELSVIAIVAQIESWDSPIARVTRGNKLRPMINEVRHGDHDDAGLVHRFLLRKLSFGSSSTNTS